MTTQLFVTEAGRDEGSTGHLPECGGIGSWHIWSVKEAPEEAAEGGRKNQVPLARGLWEGEISDQVTRATWGQGGAPASHLFR